MKNLILIFGLVAVSSVVMTSRAAFCQSTTQEKQSSALRENEIKSFVYHWFSLFDRNAPVGEFLPFLASSNLEMKFPEATLRSAKDFENWYAGILKRIRKASHRIDSIKVSIDEKTQSAMVDFKVTWQATEVGGKSLEFTPQQHWRLITNNGQLFIEKYEVKAAQ